jgi:hypothetical protein
MLESLGALFVHRPLNIVALAAVFLVAWAALRFGGVAAARHPNALPVLFGACLLYALWEWLVMTRSPEANIRIDLPVIWLALLIVTV